MLIAGKYRLRRLLGEGAMGVVWAAVNERTEREVALKLINGENEGLRKRLLREARACGRLVHRNIIEIYDVGETDEGEPFLVMPLLSGETLGDRLEREGLFPPPLAARIASDIARGLATAHAAGIVHRDLKPANVFLHQEAGGDDSFVVKVLDFGVSKMVNPADATSATQAGGAVGSPLYMSPEQALGDAGVGPRSDLWAVGVLLYEMLTGTRPFYASTAFAVVAKILRGPIPTVVERAPGVDPALAAVVARCLVRRPVDRLGSAAELVALLEPFAGARAQAAPVAPQPEPGFDEEEPTAFFRKPRNAEAAAAEMMAAAELLSSAEVLASGDVLASAPIALTMPLPEAVPAGVEAPSSSRDAVSSSTTAQVLPDEPEPHEGEPGPDVEVPLAVTQRRLWGWLAVVWVGLVVLGVGFAGYLWRSRAVPVAATAPVPLASAAVVPPAPMPPPPPTASAEPSAAVSASAKPSAAPAAPVVATAAAPARAAGQNRPAAPAQGGGSKIIRESPF